MLCPVEVLSTAPIDSWRPEAAIQEVKIYPYYRMSTYEIVDSEGYRMLCDMFLKYYAEKVPVCIALGHHSMHRDNLAAIWLIGREAVDKKTKQTPNSEPIGSIIWCSDWPDIPDMEVERT